MLTSLIMKQVRRFKVGKSPRSNEIFQVPIESLNKQGAGICTIEWDTIQKQIEPTKLVVRGALPGETVRVRVVSVFSKGGSGIHTVRLLVFGRRENLIRPRKDTEPWRSSLEEDLLPPGHQESPDYEPFDCPHFDRRHDEQSCRGCSVPHLNYKRQIIEKTKLLKKSLSGALDQSILSELKVEPRSQIKRFSNTHEVFAFSKRPLGTPVWGQLSWKDPLPGERREKHFVATPECRLVSKSAQAVLKRMSELIGIAHESNPSLFAVHSEILNRGYLKSAVIETSKNQNDENQLLVSIFTSPSPPDKFKAILKADVADRLLAEFPLLKGVNLISNHEALCLSGYPTIPDFVPSVGKELFILSGQQNNQLDSEVKSKLMHALMESLCDLGPNDRIMEITSHRGASYLTNLLGDVSSCVESYSESDIQVMLDGVNPPRNDSLAIPSTQASEANHSLEEDRTNIVSAAVISFPVSAGKSDIKGVTSKEFRHWLGKVVKPHRVVILTEHFDGLRKDIGHLKLLGYEIKAIKAVDAKPGVMDKIATIVVLQRKPRYQELVREQFIE